MTILLALGWPVAGFFAWRWRVAVLECAAWQNTSDAWESASIAWEQNAKRASDQADQALKLAEDWKNAALLLNASLYQPLGLRKAGNAQ